MIANYGYSDAEGQFFITLDTGKCEGCPAKPCIAACPAKLIVEEENPYGGAIVGIDETKRKKLKYECDPCKTKQGKPLPCIDACPFNAVTHSW